MVDAPLPESLCNNWRDFLAVEREPGQDICEELFDHPLLFPLQRKREMAAMMQLARSIKPKNLLIVGGDKGGDCYSFIHALPSLERIVTVEIRGTPYIGQFQAAFPRIEMLGIGASSYAKETVAQVTSFIGSGKFDFVFLDGDKNKFVIDFDLYSAMTRKGGIVALHDINPVGNSDPTVAAWKSICGRGLKTIEIVDLSEGVEAQKREKLGGKPRNSHDGWNMIWGSRSCGVGVVHV